jgi:lipopolysaccharide transport system permease protein
VGRRSVTALNPIATAREVWQARELLRQLVRRDVLDRHKGSFLGILWSIVQPLTTLVLYTFVFGVLLHVRWGTGESTSQLDYALTLFCGMIVFGVFAEGVMRAPSLVLEHPNFVKKVVFPLEILPVAALGSVLINAGLAFAVLLAAVVVHAHGVSPTVLALPLVLVPLLLLTLGLGWFLAALGVYVRDTRQVTAIVVGQFLLFLTPVFYPLSVVPDRLRWLIALNPLAILVEQARRVVLWGLLPEWDRLLGVTLLGVVVMQLGYRWFMRAKRGFPDVL